VLQADEDAIFELGLDIRAFKALAILGGTGAEEFTIQLKNMEQAAGANNLAFEKMLDTTANQFNLFKNQLNVELQKAGEQLLPALTDAIKIATFAFKEGIEPLGSWVKELQNIGEKIRPFTVFGLIFSKIAEKEKEAAKEAQDLAIEIGRLGEEIRELLGEGPQEIAEAFKNAEKPAKTLATETFNTAKFAKEIAAFENMLLDDLNQIVPLTQEMSFWELMALTNATGVTAETEKSVSSMDRLAISARNFSNAIAEAQQNQAGFVSLLNQALDIIDQISSGGGGLFGTIVGGAIGFVTGGPAGAFAGAQAGGQIGSRIFGKHGFDFTVPGNDTGMDDKRVTMNVRGGERLIAVPPGGGQVQNSSGNTFNLSFPSITKLDEFEIRTKIIPIMNQLAQRREVQILATGMV